jgi:hypothetical protein
VDGELLPIHKASLSGSRGASLRRAHICRRACGQHREKRERRARACGRRSVGTRWRRDRDGLEMAPHIASSLAACGRWACDLSARVVWPSAHMGRNTMSGARCPARGGSTIRQHRGGSTPPSTSAQGPGSATSPTRAPRRAVRRRRGPGRCRCRPSSVGSCPRPIPGRTPRVAGQDSCCWPDGRPGKPPPTRCRG